MLLLAEIHRDFECEASQLFKFLSNIENYSLWFPGATKARAIDELTLHSEGKHYKVDFYRDGQLLQHSVKIKKFDASGTIVTESDLDPLFPQMTVSVRQTTANHCLLSLKIHSNVRNLDERDLFSYRQDLHARVKKAMLNLNAMFGQHIFHNADNTYYFEAAGFLFPSHSTLYKSRRRSK